MANTRARSYNTLTYNGGKHMLNSKIAMKKRLLHKYKLDPALTSTCLPYPKQENENNIFKLHRQRISADKNKEDVESEVIDVETVAEAASSTLQASPSQTPAVDAEEPSTSGKASLEQVVARCRLRSGESELLSSRSSESSTAAESPTINKSALESLKAVVNSVNLPDSAETDAELSESSSAPSSSGDRGATVVSPKRFLSPHAKTILNEWFRKHLYRPYPTYEEKKELAKLCNISSSKVDTWFANKRNRTHNTKKLPPKYSHLLSLSTILTD